MAGFFFGNRGGGFPFGGGDEDFGNLKIYHLFKIFRG